MRRALGTALSALLLTGCGSTTGTTAPATSPPRAPGEQHVVGRQIGAARIPGAGEAVAVTRQRHPRGGYQIHLYALVHGRPVEVVDAGGNPVIPFVSTDTRPVPPMSADCVPHGFTVTTASPTDPSGVLFAWDVRRTTYQLVGAHAVAVDHRRLRTSIPPAQLRTALPDLAHHRLFPSCWVHRLAG